MTAMGHAQRLAGELEQGFIQLVGTKTGETKTGEMN
jgi:hypothetical protein